MLQTAPPKMAQTATPPRKFQGTPKKPSELVTWSESLLRHTTLVWYEYDSLLCPACILPSFATYNVNPSTFLRA